MINNRLKWHESVHFYGVLTVNTGAITVWHSLLLILLIRIALYYVFVINSLTSLVSQGTIEAAVLSLSICY